MSTCSDVENRGKTGKKQLVTINEIKLLYLNLCDNIDYLLYNMQNKCYNIAMSKYHCPICGDPANSRHHLTTRAEGGSDNPRNLVWLCKPCHDVVEGIYGDTGVAFSCELLHGLRMKRNVRLDEDSDGCEAAYKTVTGGDGELHYLLLHLILPGKTKQIINQWVNGCPECNDDNIITTTVLPKRRERTIGRPVNSKIDTQYLEELRYNKGFSYRKIESLLKLQGFTFKHASIRFRLMQGKRYVPQETVICRYCGNEFIPKGTRKVFCCRICYLANNRYLCKRPRRNNDQHQ